MEPNITFSSCIYKLCSKFDISVYKRWMARFSNASLYNLVIYTHAELFEYVCLQFKDNSRIKVVQKELEEFYTYRYKTQWEENHPKNKTLLHTGWELNMLWSEKIHFVNETVTKNYFNTDYYGWIDIGYFREDYLENSSILERWPNPSNINNLDKTKIYYARVNNDENYFNHIERCVLSGQRPPDDQVSIAGGFFILDKSKIRWWVETYDNKLKHYFDNHFLVKDDQIIIIDCIFSNKDHFMLTTEKAQYDNWFMFTRLLG